MTVLVEKVTMDLLKLLLFWFIWVIFFALQSLVLGTNNSDSEKFHGASRAVGYFFQSFENGIGHIIRPSMDYWKHLEDKMVVDKIIIHLIWTFWIF